MPGTVQLAHLRNPQPDIGAARAAGEAAAAAAAARRLFGQRAADHGFGGRNAYVKGFRVEMQRQYDAAARLPRCGDTQDFLQSFFFQPYDCSALSQACFVAWQVKVALGLLAPGRPPAA